MGGVCVSHWTEIKVMGMRRDVRLVYSGFAPHLNSLMILPQRRLADTEAGSSLTTGGVNILRPTREGEFFT